jgi:hypothetical protein
MQKDVYKIDKIKKSLSLKKKFLKTPTINQKNVFKENDEEEEEEDEDEDFNEDKILKFLKEEKEGEEGYLMKEGDEEYIKLTSKKMKDVSRYFNEDKKLIGIESKEKRCYNCAGMNHSFYDCPNFLCNSCSQFGHKIKNCPYKFEKKCEWCNKTGHIESIYLNNFRKLRN